MAVSHQREALCDLLDSLTAQQWAAETLCDGWDAGDVAAHLLVREREPWTMPGIVLGGALGKLTERRMRARKERTGRESLIAALRAGPPLPLRAGPAGRMQIAEDWVHGEDVRRGGAQAGPGPADPASVRDALWSAIGLYARQTLSALRVPGVVALEDDGGRRRAFKVGGRLALGVEGAAGATVHGAVGELALWAAGRTGAARVEIAGSDERLVAAVKSLEASV